MYHLATKRIKTEPKKTQTWVFLRQKIRQVLVVLRPVIR